MKRFLLASAAIFGVCGSAAAADLKAPVVVPPQVYNWTGLYIGIYLGGAVADRNANSTEPTKSVAPRFYNTPNGADNNYALPSSFIGGGTIGVNYQPGVSNWVVGVEGETGYIRLSRSVIDVNSVAFGSDSTDRTKIGDWYGVFAGRFGYAYDRALFYGKAGAAFVQKSARYFDNCIIAPCSATTLDIGTDGTQFTWAAGAGLEYAFADNWSIKGEYLYLATRELYSYSGQSVLNGVPQANSFTSAHSDPGVHTAKIGINYRWPALH
jgi:outer membrane immunogenic protein